MKEVFNPNEVYANKSHKPSIIHKYHNTEAEKLSPIKLGQLVRCTHHGTSDISVLEVIGIISNKEKNPYFSYYLRGMRGNRVVDFYSFGQTYVKPFYCHSKAELERVRVKWCLQINQK